MCVVALAWRPQGWGTGASSGSRGPHLVVIANRDEFHSRGSASLDVLDSSSLLVGGRDLERRGGWLWASAKGRMAAVTNVRAPRGTSALTEGTAAGSSAAAADRASTATTTATSIGASTATSIGASTATTTGASTATTAGSLEGATESRGSLVATFTTSALATDDYLRDLDERAQLYGRFNLLVYDGLSLGYASNVPGYQHRALPPGVYSLSNGSLDTPWPKTERVRQALATWLTSPDAASREIAPLFQALGDDRPVRDEELPDTGVGLAIERMLAPPFIRSPTYGTRCSSVVIYSDEEMIFAERRFGIDGVCTGETVVTIPRSHRAKR